jgi:chemotaxis receptor (MCP) glutamine deamidase CheD
MSPYYKQTLRHLNTKEDTIEVSMGKYILSHKNQASTLKTLLGSCVALVGFKE